jgi:1-deoxy-D-xylulose-5-phosphate synthase
MDRWLSKIKDPKDLRGMKVEDLTALADEIRELMLKVTSDNGGHLASNLGTVELTLALHCVFDTPEDRIVWDVGHQAYPHKIVTGRADRFPTIRRQGGLSGFLRRDESPYDAFGAGHASTAISAAVGMAIARDARGLKHKIVAVVGDGALSGGMCYEALNHGGHLGSDLLVVLNDNDMAISRNVGALSATFNRLVMTRVYNERRRDIIELIKRLPAGKRFLAVGDRLEESIKSLILPSRMFEALGFRYLGPIDGHNLEELIPVLQKIRSFSGPIILHVLTKKGKGRPYSEADPITFHSPPSNFDADSGEAPAKKDGPPAWSKVFVDALREEARRDVRLVAVSAAMLEGTGLSSNKFGFETEFPGRTFDVGIAEEHAVTAAAGMACDGLRPFVCIYSTFLQRAIDQIIHDVAIQKLPVKFALDRAGLVGDDGPTHHGAFDLTYLRMIPGMVVMAPRDADEMRDMTHTAALYEDGPIALRFSRGAVAQAPDLSRPARALPIGKGELLREGERACLVGIGLGTEHALAAARMLAESGIEAGVIDARFVKPLDRELLLAAARDYEWLVTIEDNVLAGGFGSAVTELLVDEGVQAKVVRLGIPDAFIEHGAPDALYRQCDYSPEAIAARVRELVAPVANVRELRQDSASPESLAGR